MVAKLRKKFVIVTTSLMVITFGLFSLASQLYNDYWITVDMADYLELVADSGLFLQDGQNEMEQKILDMADGGNPIIGLIVNRTGEILDSRIIGNDSGVAVPEKTLRMILENGSSKYKAGNYIYAYKKLKDGTSLIVLTDPSMNANLAKKAMGTIFLSLCGIFVLVALTFFFVAFCDRTCKEGTVTGKAVYFRCQS